MDLGGGRSVGDPVATLNELTALGVAFCSDPKPLHPLAERDTLPPMKYRGAQHT